ncbi:hypothetical protein Barb4_02787 [Bacteroidales bacterium Barb4]|nr:hypothetical protein Barb4_02787 [Bacteroidales bacterium Barb4]
MPTLRKQVQIPIPNPNLSKDITHIPKECKISAPHEAKRNVGLQITSSGKF